MYSLDIPVCPAPAPRGSAFIAGGFLRAKYIHQHSTVSTASGLRMNRITPKRFPRVSRMRSMGEDRKEETERRRDDVPPLLILFTSSSLPRLPLLTSSRAQPEPKRPVPAAPIFSLNPPCPSNDPNVLLIASARPPVGAPPPPFPAGAMICQNIEWLTCPPALLRTAVRFSS